MKHSEMNDDKHWPNLQQQLKAAISVIIFVSMSMGEKQKNVRVTVISHVQSE
jgi:hypothetical protein